MTDDFVCLLLSLTFLKPSQKPQTVCNKESRKRCKAEGRGHIGGQQQEGKEKQQIQRHNNIFFSGRGCRGRNQVATSKCAAIPRTSKQPLVSRRRGKQSLLRPLMEEIFTLGT